MVPEFKMDGEKKAAPTEWEPPAACINRIVKAALPDQVQVTKEAKLAFSKSAGIFILYLTTCANDFCKDKKRQTVSAADVMQAVSELDFDEFKDQLQAFLASFRANEGSKRKPKTKRPDTPAGDTPMEEPAAQEEEPLEEEEDDEEDDDA